MKKILSIFRIDNPYLWALALRIGLLLWMKPHPQGDAGDFELLARNLAAGHGFSRCWTSPFPPTAQRPPLYPLLLSLFYWVGASEIYFPAILNMAIDLVTMKVSKKFAQTLGLPHAGAFPWIIALCPLLITMGNYPLTENISVLLFFLSTLYLFQGGLRKSGFFFGLLSLCRSYYLIFPWLLAIFRPLKKLSAKGVAFLIAFSLLAPACWVARNLVVFPRPVFSQTGTAAFQSYQGLCFRDFDWWRSDDVRAMQQAGPFGQIMMAQCLSDDQILALNSQGWDLVKECVKSNPGGTVVNVLVKGWELFVAWGQIFPYDFVPFSERYVINGLVFLLWVRMIWIWFANREKMKTFAPVFRYVFLNFGYVILVTLPFAIDARYLLAPGLLAFGMTLQCLDDPLEFFGAPVASFFKQLDG
jgi:hypothetical protein